METTPAVTVDNAIKALQAARSLLGSNPNEEIITQITALTGVLEGYNTDNAANAGPPKANASISYKSGTGFLEKPGGSINLVFKAKPTASEVDLGKLTGRVKAVFMGIKQHDELKDLKHIMKTTTTSHPDGIKRWGIEVMFPFKTLIQANKAAKDMGKPEIAQGVTMVKEYLEKNKSPDSVPFSSTVQLDFECTVASLVQFLDPAGEYRSQANATAGPEASVPKQVERFHAELLQHIDMVDSITLKTQERDLTISLGNLRLADFFSAPSEDVPAVSIDLHPLQEVMGGLGMGMVGGAVGMTDKILYRNDISVEKSVENTTPAEAGLTFEDVSVETDDGETLACWLITAAAQASSPTLLYLHGNAGDMASRLDHVKALQAELSCNVFMVSYRGYGRSTGKPSEEGLMEDATASLKFLANNANIDSNKIIIFGHSIGGAVGIHLAAAPDLACPVAGLIVENTFTSIAEMAGPILRRVDQWLPSKWKNCEKVQTITCPILFLSGRSDTIVPCEMMDLLKLAATASSNSSLVEFPTQGHNDTMDGENYYASIKTFVTAI